MHINAYYDDVLANTRCHMAKKPEFVRTTITIPAAIKKKMDTVKEPVNWSAIASHAFERKLEEIVSRKAEENMSEVVKRLRASKRNSDSNLTGGGREIGKSWASENAEYYQLKNLAAAFPSDGYGPVGWVATFRSEDAFSPGERLAGIIEGRDDMDRREMRDFWQSQPFDGELIEQIVYDRNVTIGFVEGALEVWEQVRDQV